jgi:hypothetical protein
MKQYNEIKQIITEHFGITSLETYKVWLAKWRSGEWKPTEEDLIILSPDVVDCFDFWNVANDLFGNDCVCNVADGNKAHTQMESNRTNLFIARQTGLLAHIDSYRDYKLNVLELGAGYGSLKNYIEANTQFSYTGFDVFPKIPEILPTDKAGMIPDEFIQNNIGKFQLITASNVLQHLSTKQKVNFFNAAHKLLSAGQVLSFNLNVFSSRSTNKYMTLYGQFIEMLTNEEIAGLIDGKFGLVTSTTRMYDGLTGFTFIKV